MTYKRAVLDTNIIISALLFRGPLSRLHAFWKEKAFSIVASKDIVEEYIRVLAYPKFRLTRDEIEAIFQEELLPYIEPVTVPDKLKGACADPDDDKFLACAAAAKADVIVSGDAHLLTLKKPTRISIIPPEKFLARFK